MSPTARNVQPSAGVWDADSAHHHLHAHDDRIDRGRSCPFTYDVKVDDPQVGNATKINTVVATATSYPRPPRCTAPSATPPPRTRPVSAVGYRASAPTAPSGSSALSLTKSRRRRDRDDRPAARVTRSTSRCPAGLDLLRRHRPRPAARMAWTTRPARSTPSASAAAGSPRAAITPTANPRRLHPARVLHRRRHARRRHPRTCASPTPPTSTTGASRKRCRSCAATR